MKNVFLRAFATFAFGNPALSFATYDLAHDPVCTYSYDNCDSYQYGDYDFSCYENCEPAKSCWNSFKTGTTEINLYGFIKLEGLWVNRLTGNFPEVFPQNVPLNEDRADRHSQTIIDARSSRIGINVNDVVYGIKMKGVIEGDFFDAGGDALVFNSRFFRLRLAYAKAEMPNGFFLLAGQFWTLPAHNPDIEMPMYLNTQLAPVGVAYARQPQLRLGYKHQVSELGIIQFEGSVEKHGFNDLGFLTPTGTEPIQGGEEPWPLFAGKISWLSDKFKWSVDGAISQTRYIPDITGRSLKKTIWAVSAIAKYKVDRLALWGTINYNVGLSSMFMGYFNNVAIDRFSHLFAFKSNGGCVAARWDWIDNVLFSDVVYGIQQGQKIANTILFSGNALKSLQDFRINLFYKFWETWQAGIEYQSIYVKSFNGKKGQANDIHCAIWYNFGTTP